MSLRNQKQHADYNKNAVSREIRAGDLVVCRLGLQDKTRTKSLSTVVRGPFRVESVYGYQVTVKSTTGKKVYPIALKHVLRIQDVFSERMVSWSECEAKLFSEFTGRGELLDPLPEEVENQDPLPINPSERSLAEEYLQKKADDNNEINVPDDVIDIIDDQVENYKLIAARKIKLKL